MRIGIDIGNVIIGGGGEDTSFFGDNYINTPPVEGVYESIRDLKMAGHELHIISKCGVTTEWKSVEWLRVNLADLIPNHRMHFVRKRPLKAYMAMALELDIFIDDREDIIGAMKGVVEHPILFTSWGETNKELGRIFNDKA